MAGDTERNNGPKRTPDSRQGHESHPLAMGNSGPRDGTGGPRKARRPLPPGEQFFTPGATGMRKAVERRSAAPLVFLFQLPRWIIPVVLLALLLLALALPDWRGALAVVPVLAFVGLLAYLSWPSLRVGGKIMRVALVTFLLLVAADRLGLL